MILRPYQQDIKDAVSQAFRQGYKRPLVVLGCGGGKSYIFADMAKSTCGDVLILTHRRELLNQHRELLKKLGIHNARISMVMTEANRLGQYPKPRLLILDEAHLSRSKSWTKVLEYYDTYTVGFTGSPIRLDGRPLGDIYDIMIQGKSVKWLIENKYLAPYEYYAPTVVETDGLRKQAGDYVISDLEQLMSDRAIYSDVWESWERLAKGKKTIAYCVSVKHARETAEMFNSKGVRAVAIDGNTPDKQRTEIMEKFRTGEITVLCNCAIVSEGVSVDDVECTLLLRPTDSTALFIQQSMRSMRYKEGKVALIIDCTGNYTRHPLPDADIEWSLTQSVKKRKQFDSEGNFAIRTCPSCFKVFATAKECPYCGNEYPLHPREIKAHKDIELQRITAEEMAKIEQQKKEMRMEVGRARTVADLWKIARKRGYADGWVWQMARAKGIRIK